MTPEQTSATLGNILAKRAAIGKFRDEMLAARPGHWIVTDYNASKITAWLKSGEAEAIIQKMTDSERQLLVMLAGAEAKPAIPARPSAGTPADETEPEPVPVPAAEVKPEPVPVAALVAEPEPVKPEPAPAVEAVPEPVKPAKPAPAAPMGSAESQLAALIRQLAEGAKPAPAEAPPLDQAAIREIVRAELAENPPAGGISTLRLERPDKPVVEITGRQHFRFPLILAALQAEIPALLVGPAGTGKTSAVMHAAEALSLSCFPMAFSPMTTQANLVGFVDAGGTYRETGFVKAFRDGGIFLADEFDATRSDVAIILNGAIANRVLMLPTGEVLRAHVDFQTIACANTFGTGPDALYTGRNRLDAATLDRFFTLEIPPDEGLEASLVGVAMDSPPCDLAAGGIPTPAEWLATVQTARARLAAVGAQVVISQRATLLGSALAAVGVGRDWLFSGLLAKGLKGTALDAISALR